jgi:riboflavin kinase/FMN adenylyltransferase
MKTYNTFSGTVVHGSKMGRTMGFPTLNIDNIKENIPTDGVYIVGVDIHTEHYFGIMSIGNRPTFEDEGNRTVEIYLLDVTNNWYDSCVSVTPLVYIRSNVKFDSMTALKIQIEKDKNFAQNYIKTLSK